MLGSVVVVLEMILCVFLFSAQLCNNTVIDVCTRNWTRFDGVIINTAN